MKVRIEEVQFKKGGDPGTKGREWLAFLGNSQPLEIILDLLSAADIRTLVSVGVGETDEGLLSGKVLIAPDFTAGLSSTSGLIPNSALSLLIKHNEKIIY